MKFMGGSKTTTTTTVTQTAEEKEYTKQQIELAKQQLRILEEQHGYQSEIYAMTKPLLEKYMLLVDEEFTQMNDPATIALRDKQRQLDTANLDAALRNLPIQEELLQRQLDEIRRGGAATDEQKRLIADITQRAIESGDTDISRFMATGIDQIRNQMAPARGMRPDDAPMIDAAQRVLEEAVRQKGKLTADMRGAQANAELNFPLNAGQMSNSWNQWQQTFNQGMNEFLSGLKTQAAQNRTQLMGQLFASPMTAFEQGNNLIQGARPNPVDFPRNTTQTTKQGSNILGGIGGLLSGIGSVGSLFSSRKAKTNIKPLEAPPGHLLSPGSVKENIKSLGGVGQIQSLGGAGGGPYNGKPTPDLPQINPTWAGPKQTPDLPQINPGWAGPKPSFDMPQINPTWAGPKVIPDIPQINPGPGGYGGTVSPPRTDEEALDRIGRMPVSTWNYKPQTGLPGETHVGPMAEDFNTMVMGKGPQPFINTVDAVGSLMASVKALDKRTRGLGMTPKRRRQPQTGGVPAWPRG
jgi:hypothetical protein